MEKTSREVLEYIRTENLSGRELICSEWAKNYDLHKGRGTKERSFLRPEIHSS